MAETDLERSARLLAQHMRAALPHARALFQDSTEAGLEARSLMRNAANSRHAETLASVTFFLDAIVSERTRQMTINQCDAVILTLDWPYSP